MLNSRGQTLIELLVVVTVAIIVITALVFATITSLRNAELSKNQIQASKYAQEGIEKVRSIRNRDGELIFTDGGGPIDKFSGLWNKQLNSSCVDYCYFKLYRQDRDADGNPDDYLNSETISSFEDLTGEFQRQVQMIDNSTTYSLEKTINVIVKWRDFAGEHESKLTTVLGKI
ncbi:MAG: prepilin-type N-terminal cleavage/methylation domain-containing protein [Candidatus Daviesbacteria bacterium]|nr:prepilin-type N-terminal cleavage/methylation domain-containing protein [Candidatus Daviesbacteria bacterium]